MLFLSFNTVYLAVTMPYSKYDDLIQQTPAETDLLSSNFFVYECFCFYLISINLMQKNDVTINKNYLFVKETNFWLNFSNILHHFLLLSISGLLFFSLELILLG